jgi:hypothetical protein
MVSMVRATCAAASLFAVLLGNVVQAQAQSNCANYGFLALKQARENEQRKCGNTGPRWTTDLKAHVAWCATVGPNAWRNELRERARALQNCRK